MSSLEWKITVDEGYLEARGGSSLFWYNSSLNIFGGGSEDLNLTQIDVSTKEIRKIELLGEDPGYRQVFPFAVFDDYFYMFPGYSYPIGNFKLDCFRLSLKTKVSQSINCSFTSVYTSFTQYENTLFLFGGETFNQITNDLLQVQLSETLIIDTVTPTNTYPNPRTGHTMARCSQYLWLFAGCSSGS